MKKLIAIRTVYNVDPEKTFRIADILEAGAILPHSVPLNELLVSDLVMLDELEGSETSMSAQLNDAGYGSQGIF
jgi:hypothetical protein